VFKTDGVASLSYQLEREQLGRHETIQQIYDQLYHLWAMLGVQEEDMENFVNTWTGSTLEVIAAVRSPIFFLSHFPKLRASDLTWSFSL